MTDASRILFVDDDQDCCLMMSILLESADKNVTLISAGSAEEALNLIETEKFDLFILDYWLPDSTGVDLCGRIRHFDARTPIVFYSGMARDADRQKAAVAGANEYLIKPNDLDRISETIQKYLKTNG